MKKFVALLLALAMVFALCACGNSNASAPKQDDAAESSQPSDNAAENQPAADLSALKVGFIFLHDENSTYDLNFMNAAKEACETLGVESVFKTNIPEDQSCYEAAAELAATSSLPTASVTKTISFRPPRSSLKFSSATPPAPRLTPRVLTTTTTHSLPSMKAVTSPVLLPVSSSTR